MHRWYFILLLALVVPMVVHAQDPPPRVVSSKLPVIQGPVWLVNGERLAVMFDLVVVAGHGKRMPALMLTTRDGQRFITQMTPVGTSAKTIGPGETTAPKAPPMRKGKPLTPDALERHLYQGTKGK